MSERDNFLQRCLDGDVLDPDEEIDDEIDEWHDSSRKLPPLHEFLGMSWEEYQLWVEKPWTLKSILAARKTGSSLDVMVRVSDGGTALAARGVEAEEFSKVRQWLRQTKRL